MIPTQDEEGELRVGADSWWRYSLLLAALAAAYFVGGKLGLRLALVNASATAVWPPTGIALAAVILLGPRVWPGIFLGAFVTNLTTAGSTATCLGIATGNTLEALLGGFLVARFASGRRAFDRPRDVFGFSIYAGLLATTVSAAIGVASLCSGGMAPWARYWSIWVTWWLGDATGALLFAPLLLLWATDQPWSWTRERILELVAFSFMLAAVGVAVFGVRFSARFHQAPVGFLGLLLPLWAAFRFGQRHAGTAAVALSGIALWGTIQGRGPFVTGTPNEALLLLQGFMGVITVTSIAVAAVVAVKARTELDLRRLNEDLEARVASGTAAERAALAALAETETQYRDLFENGFGLICTHDLDGRIHSVNPAAAAALGWPAEEIAGTNLRDLLVERARPLLSGYLARLGAARQDQGTMAIRNRSGETRFWFYRNRVIERPGRLSVVLGYALDITEQRRAEGALEASQRRYRESFERGFGIVCAHALDGTVLSINPAGAEVLGSTPEGMAGRSLRDLMPESLRKQFSDTLAALPEAQTGEGLLTLRARDGELRTLMYRHRWIADGDPPYVLAHALDITERLQAEEDLRQQTLHDPLTGCANRVLFGDRVQVAVARARRSELRDGLLERVAVIYIDLDGFKQVNDLYGHAAGDVFLRLVAERLRGHVRAVDLVARLGGDEFGVVVAELSGADDARRVAEAVVGSLSQPFVWNDREAFIGASCGVALFPEHGETAEELLGRADAAMYAAKLEGKNRVQLA